MSQDEFASCSACGARVPRDEMFGAEPDLLCPRCAERVRQRLRPSATGRLVGTALSGSVPVTLALIGAALGLFLVSRGWTVTDPDAWPDFVQHFLAWDVHGVTVVEEPWRLATTTLLHIGPFHLVFNLLWIWVLGRTIEGRRGSLAMALLFLGSAAASSALQWLFSGPGVGLSGVVYGLAGFLMTMRRHDPVAKAVMNRATIRTLLAWLVIGVILSEARVLAIGNWAHGGGLVWGLLAGAAYGTRWQWPGWIALGLATAGLVAAVASGRVYWNAF
jgi:membrane associated rhomboid family serine protease